ncbi:DUF1176 domain-containing protein [Psychrobacter sp. DAB_AL32B]|uniref:DUF1176 domain-containing protein n=1 Tax=Psychrobacter sp. DAB_AL32B TaxID=1028414 RepID=UPI000B7F59C6|nr:DUF1176 domain-containing protein [Psychrobacter sp. DAB_AL32B]OXL25890.1 hypothetical protein CAN34_03435 [Psychrobacter sp. DAB_AL32B]
MKISTTVIMIAVSLLPLPTMAYDAYGTPFEGWGFVKDDWQLVCDNTLTCRAAGYADEGLVSEEILSASILLTIVAGEKLPSAEVVLSSEDYDEQEKLVSDQLSENTDNVELSLNDKSYGMVQFSADGKGQLSRAQLQQLLKLANQNTKIQFTSGIYKWQVSDKGLAAVLLKLDEVQGRIGTPLAFISKNNPNRQTPKKALKIPIVKKDYSYLGDAALEAGQQALDPKKLAYFQANISRWVDINSERLIGSEDGMGDCELVNPKSEASINLAEYSSNNLDWDFTPVNANYTLASHLCWRGAYNMGAGFWLIIHAKPSKPQLITTSASDYSDGEISAFHKDRGIGDCWNSRTWVWNGKTFALTEDSSTGMCRGFAGGAWNLPTYVSEVIRSDNKVQ